MNTDYNGDILHIAMCHNHEFSPLARHCCRTISNQKIKVHRKLEDVKSEGFRSPGWYSFTRMKVEMLQSTLDKAEDGEVVGMMDCDIQFFLPEKLIEVRDKMVKEKYDYVSLSNSCCSGQREIWFEPKKSQKANTGLVFLRKCSSTFGFLDDVLSKSFNKKYFGDQDVINESLVSVGLKRALLNPCLFLHGRCGNPKPKIIAHHATGTKNLDEKKSQIDKIRVLIGKDPVDWSDGASGCSCDL